MSWVSIFWRLSLALTRVRPIQTRPTFDRLRVSSRKTLTELTSQIHYQCRFNPASNFTRYCGWKDPRILMLLVHLHTTDYGAELALKSLMNV